MRLAARGEFQMLLVFLWAIVAACKREDQRIFALKLAELAQFAGVIEQFVVGENASGTMSERMIGFLPFLLKILRQSRHFYLVEVEYPLNPL